MSNDIKFSINENAETVMLKPQVQNVFYVGAKAEVTQLADGALITLTDKSGTTSAVVKNGIDGANGVKGSDGKDGVSVSNITFNGYAMNIDLSNGMRFISPNLQGVKGESGNRGVGIKSVRLNSDYTLTISLEDGHEFTTTSIRGEKGETGDSGHFDTFLNDTSTNAAQTRAVKAYIDNAISGLTGFSTEIVGDTLPLEGKNGVLYLKPHPSDVNDRYEEYLWITSTGRFELVGSTTVDLSGYVKLSDFEEVMPLLRREINNRVEKEDGKGLSSNDFTDAMRDKLNTIATGATNVTPSTVSDWGFAENIDVEIDEEVKALFRRISNYTLYL